MFNEESFKSMIDKVRKEGASSITSDELYDLLEYAIECYNRDCWREPIPQWYE
jgi:hypothetical protein